MDSRKSPPKAVVDSSPLQPAISKNKESLKIKLMVRRPIAQLVDQGIMPSFKASPALYEQSKQLERAKTGDILKAKIQQRPDRQELERRHILEHDEIHLDPSLAEKQRMLKRARLADQLNSQLSHRPGPLELIKKNILHTEEPIERIVKEGLISFKATSEGLLNRPQHPDSYVTYEDDSQSSEGDVHLSPAGPDVIESGVVTLTLNIPSNENLNQTTVPELQTNIYSNISNNSTVACPITSIEPIQVQRETSNLFAELCQSVVETPTVLSSKSPISNPVISAATSSTLSSYQALQSPIHKRSDAPGKDKTRKKNKVKPVTKIKTIKFHEYKGPPNAQKNGQTSSMPEETSYQLLLKQQNFLLEYLESLNKNVVAACAEAKQKQLDNSQQSPLNQMQMSPAPSSAIPPNQTQASSGDPITEIAKLEKMKVSDLRGLLKARNLPVSGAKPQLIDRLRPFIHELTADLIKENGNEIETRNTSPPAPEIITMDIKLKENEAFMSHITNDTLLQEQQRKIDDLQRKLKESQRELQQMRQSHQQPVQAKVVNDTNRKQVLKQQLVAKIQKDKFQRQLNTPPEGKEHVQENIAVNLPKPAQPNKMDFYWNGETTLFLINLPDDKNKFACDGQINNNAAATLALPALSPSEDAVSKMELDAPSKINVDTPNMQSNLNHLPLLEHNNVLSNGLISNGVLTNAVLHNGGVMQDAIMPNEVMQHDIKCKFEEMPVYRNKSVFDENIYNDDLSKQVLFDSDTSSLASPFASVNDSFMKTDKITSDFNIFDHTHQPHQHHHHHHHHHHHQDITDMEEDTTSDLRNQIGELKTFDDIELMELIGQQLDMDISDSDDTCANLQNIVNEKQSLLDEKKYFDPFLQTKANKRNLNPSLQPSLNELIQQQSQNVVKKINNNNNIDKNLSVNNNLSIINNNNNNSNINNNNNISNNSNNIINNNNINHNSNNNNNHISNSNGFQMNSMDPDYLDNNLASFEFTIPYTNVTQNHQQHLSYPQFHCTNGNTLLPNNAIDPVKFHTTSTCNQDSILDLFSADEMKITGDPLPWAEVDYAT